METKCLWAKFSRSLSFLSESVKSSVSEINDDDHDDVLHHTDTGKTERHLSCGFES